MITKLTGFLITLLVVLNSFAARNLSTRINDLDFDTDIQVSSNEILNSNQETKQNNSPSSSNGNNDIYQYIEQSQEDFQSSTSIPTPTIQPMAISIPLNSSPTPTGVPSFNPEVPNYFGVCTGTGATLNEFPNSCADSCALQEDSTLICQAVITTSCDCGPNKCWNGSTCVINP